MNKLHASGSINVTCKTLKTIFLVFFWMNDSLKNITCPLRPTRGVEKNSIKLRASDSINVQNTSRPLEILFLEWMIEQKHTKPCPLRPTRSVIKARNDPGEMPLPFQSFKSSKHDENSLTVSWHGNTSPPKSSAACHCKAPDRQQNQFEVFLNGKPKGRRAGRTGFWTMHLYGLILVGTKFL